jgi:hypothetical protein
LPESSSPRITTPSDICLPNSAGAGIEAIPFGPPVIGSRLLRVMRTISPNPRVTMAR